MKKSSIGKNGIEKNGIENSSIRDIRIKNKKDWVIFWIFAGFIAYALGSCFDDRINMWLRGIGNPWLTNLNEPQSYGRILAAVILLAILAEMISILCRKPVKTKLAIVAAGVLLPVAVLGIYQLHCNVIVSVLWDMEPRTVTVKYDGKTEYLKSYGKNGETISSVQELQEVMELCRGLTVISDKETLEECKEWYANAEDPFMGADMIILHFSEKYGHSYSFQLRLQDGHVYLWRGYSDKGVEVTFFEDNGITEWLEESSLF